ncbi:MAG: YcnI family protein [Alphaproteobacteria bacterium]|nr:YcnI family protein [Alphaproteobacteria bacterium]MBU0798174.1 YcnI family protein [Alphaproteobacteria bacterium]MBU0887607.1 YcnI family protein [Alphaproteobacteria bacterium]MBU1814259.1 YcnI family protein [Alphaproteobacteria bacterium]MBU2091000.1 YcnI family protein [Alphaproteobacteria bacterium]
MRNALRVAALLAAMGAGIPAASAHAVVEPRQAPADSYQKVTIRITHGCNGAATNRIIVAMPEQILTARPQAKPGWQIELVKEKLPEPVPAGHGMMLTERITQIIWSGNTLPDWQFDEIALSLKLPDADPGTALPFVTVQECDGGKSWHWSAEEGTHTHEHGAGMQMGPAPVLRLLEKRGAK